jgi:uncharacterized SAM-binding protein YcdF (DUF218 family)
MTRAAPRRLRILRLARISLGVAFAAILLVLPFIGRFFSAGDPLQRADAIVVLAGARVDRWLEAVDLFKEGWAPKIVLSPGPVSSLEVRLRSEGLRLPREGDIARDAVVSLGVPAEVVTVMPDGVDNTAAEAAALRRMLTPASLRRIIVVTSTYHVRRARFAFNREFAGTGVEIVAHGSRYSEARPTRWWTQRNDIRYLMNETPKFLAYVVGLGE